MYEYTKNYQPYLSECAGGLTLETMKMISPFEITPPARTADVVTRMVMHLRKTAPFLMKSLCFSEEDLLGNSFARGESQSSISSSGFL